jgi:erythromycin esterase
VTAWVARHATPLATVDPKVALDGLAPLGRSVGEAQIAGLGESAHGAAEELELKLRVLRFLIEERGFRSVAWEEDWATGQRIDLYFRGGAEDADALVGQMLAQWHSLKVAGVLHWLRGYNTGRSDKVWFVGVEYYLTGEPAYDAVAAKAPGAGRRGRDGVLEAHAYRHWPAAAQDAERGGYHTDSLVGMVVSGPQARARPRGDRPVTRHPAAGVA